VLGRDWCDRGSVIRCAAMKLEITLRGLPKAALSGVLVMGVVVACGKSDEEQQKEAAEKTEAAATDQFASDYCEAVVDCCNRVLSLPKDVPACKTRIAEIDPMMLNDAKARNDCLTQLRKVTPLNDFCTAFGNLDQNACPDVRRKDLTGAKKAGDACADVKECAPSFEGVVACRGVCQVTKRGKEGDGPCVATVGDVESNVEGDASGAEVFKCFLRDELLCDPTAKKCAKPIAVGGACADTGACIGTAYCDTDTKKCTARRANGSSCQQGECQGACVEGFCVAPAKEGAECNPTVFCATGLSCLSGKCSKPAQDARLAASCVSRDAGK
jgi:hypothetical protein